MSDDVSYPYYHTVLIRYNGLLDRILDRNGGRIRSCGISKCNYYYIFYIYYLG